MTQGRGRRWAIIAVAVLAGAVCACSKASDIAAAAPSAAAPVEDSFGPSFGQAFRAAPNSTPMVPSPADVTPVNPTGEPLRIP